MPNKPVYKASELNRDILRAVDGYEAGLVRKHAREKEGSDKREMKGQVATQIAKLHPKRLQLKVIDIIQETDSTKTFRFASTQGKLPPFQAGQYINLYVIINGVNTARPYAISSPPSEREYYDLTVKIVKNGFVTNHLLHDVNVGDTFSATSPMGTFYHNPLFHGHDLVFLAGGSGGAPARAMIQSALTSMKDISYHLIYGNSFEDDVIFQEHFRQLAHEHHNFHVHEIISRPDSDYTGMQGHLTRERILKCLGDITGKTFYVCGPTPFNDFCISELKSLGVPNRLIRVECNGPPKNVSELESWPTNTSEEKIVTVTVQGKGQFKAKAGEPLLNSLERNGYTAENACRSGECSLCRVKVLSGQVFNPPEAKLRKSDKQFGWVHSCVAFPTKDIEILY